MIIVIIIVIIVIIIIVIIIGNALWELSPQQLASCVSSCAGCGGGDTIAAYEYLINGSTPLASV
jgi:hypothetical protein